MFCLNFYIHECFIDYKMTKWFNQINVSQYLGYKIVHTYITQVCKIKCIVPVTKGQSYDFDLQRQRCKNLQRK
jgi:hypothetical protein